MNVIFFIVYALMGWKFGNWYKFQRYYSTLLFFIIGDFIYQFLLYKHPMWTFSPVGPIDHWLHMNHTLITFGRMMVQYPVTIAIFLGRMPKSNTKKIMWIILWIGIYSVSELINNATGVLTYHNDWNYRWDLIFNAIIFTMLYLHSKKPLIAWILCLPIILGLLWIFDVPFSVLK